jgi:putative transposase
MKEKISAYVIDETVIIVGSEFIWVWVAIEPESKEILGMSISKERNMFVVIEQFISDVVDEYGELQFQQLVEHGIHKLAGS